MVALAAMISVGMTSCDKVDNSSFNGCNNCCGGTTITEWVDLGLPSGRLWAKCNLGAKNPEDCGNYYAWGETTTKEIYGWSTYKYCNGDYNQLTKYCSNSDYGYNGFTDSLITLQTMDDAVMATLSSSARIPTKEEWQELITNTISEWTLVNGVIGWKFIAANGNTLFLPAAGFRVGSGFNEVGTDGHYWSASLHENNPGGAWRVSFSSHGLGIGSESRDSGFPVRAVRSS